MTTILFRCEFLDVLYWTSQDFFRLQKKKGMANCRQCDRSKATGTVWHKEPEQQRFKKNVKVRAEAHKVKAGDEVSGP